MRVIKNPFELQARLKLIISQWETINKMPAVSSKDKKLERLSNWISQVNSELNAVNSLDVKELSK